MNSKKAFPADAGNLVSLDAGSPAGLVTEAEMVTAQAAHWEMSKLISKQADRLGLAQEFAASEVHMNKTADSKHPVSLSFTLAGKAGRESDKLGVIQAVEETIQHGLAKTNADFLREAQNHNHLPVVTFNFSSVDDMANTVTASLRHQAVQFSHAVTGMGATGVGSASVREASRPADTAAVAV